MSFATIVAKNRKAVVLTVACPRIPLLQTLPKSEAWIFLSFIKVCHGKLNVNNFTEPQNWRQALEGSQPVLLPVSIQEIYVFIYFDKIVSGLM